MKKEKRVRSLFFVCVGINKIHELKTKSIQASTSEEASTIFNSQFGFDPKDILGPFYKKQTKILANTTAIKMTAKWENAEYNGWNVKVNILKEPQNYVYILYNSRIDGQNLQKPQGAIVPIYDLRILNVK